AIGGKLHGLWYAFGNYDGYALAEAPDNTATAGVVLTLSSSGKFRSLSTTVLLTVEETLDALRGRRRPRPDSRGNAWPGDRRAAHAAEPPPPPKFSRTPPSARTSPASSGTPKGIPRSPTRCMNAWSPQRGPSTGAETDPCATRTAGLRAASTWA